MTRLAVRKLTETGVAPLGNLVKGDALQLIVAAARALEELQTEGRRAHEAAVARGREEGEAEGRQAAAALMAQTVMQVRMHRRKAEQRLVQIVVEAVRRILGNFDDTELVSGIVGQLVRDAEGEGRVSLRVAPAQLASVRERARILQKEFSDTESIDVVADPSVAANGCRMETEMGFVSTSVDDQLDALQLALEQYVAE